MHDTLSFLSIDPYFRKDHHNKLTFRMLYAEKENWVLALSHDEVVHEKGSIYQKMFGNHIDRIKQIKLLFAWMYAGLGKKHIFMGMEFGQLNEWDHENELEWFLLKKAEHLGISNWIRDLNRLYSSSHALHFDDTSSGDFQWVDCDKQNDNVISLLRKSNVSSEQLWFVFNFSPVEYFDYKFDLSIDSWEEVLNSDSLYYDGSNKGNLGVVQGYKNSNGSFSHYIDIPPLTSLIFQNSKRQL